MSAMCGNKEKWAIKLKIKKMTMRSSVVGVQRSFLLEQRGGLANAQEQNGKLAARLC